uniref:Uncharacterized protein n=1 Tax=Tanacetum cinerariifolium TaxID=118510 RepID=A0A6L2MAD2_TANCI|nr:hypothetical protein [Tanacetum cinerariifolium]
MRDLFLQRKRCLDEMGLDGLWNGLNDLRMKIRPQFTGKFGCKVRRTLKKVRRTLGVNAIVFNGFYWKCGTLTNKCGETCIIWALSKDFHKTHPSGSGTITKTAPSAAKIKPFVTNKGIDVKPGVPDVTEEESFESEAESWGNDKDDRNNEQDSRSEGSDEENDSDDHNTQFDSEKGSDFEHETDENESDSKSNQEENEEEIGDDEEEEDDEFVRTPSNDSDDETNISDNPEGDKDEEMDYTTSQLYNDVDIRLNEPVDINEGFIQKEGTNDGMINIWRGNDNPEISQVIEDAHVTLCTVPQKTEASVTNSSHSSDLASKFLKFLDISHTDSEIVSLVDVHVHHEVPSKQIPTLLTEPVSVITESSPIYSTVILQSNPSFTPPSPQSTSTPPPITELTNPPFTLPDFASVFQFNNRFTTLEKEVVELKKDDPLKTQVIALVDEHLDARLGDTRDEFMNFLSTSITPRITKQVKNELPQILPEEVSNFASLPLSSYEATASLIKFELKKILIDKMDKSESYLANPEHRVCYDGLVKSYELDKTFFSTYDKVYSLKRSQKDKDKDEDSSAGSDRGLKKRKTSKDAEPTKGLKAKESQSGSSKGDQSQSKYSRKSVQSKEPEFEALSEKTDWENPKGGDNPFDLTKTLPLVMNENRQMTKAAQYDLPGIEDMVLNIWNLVKVAYDKHALWVTRVEVIRKHRLTNISYDDDVFDFAITLRMFTRSIVIQKRVEDLQLAVKSYQKNINDTKPETTKPSIRKKDPYTPYQDPQGFIYVDTLGKNRLMRSNELYKFSDGTLTRLRTLLEDITKNIHMKYMPKKIWSTLEKKKANIMIKAIDKQLKERRMMMSLENQNRRDLPRDILLDSVQVLRYEKRRKSKNKGKVPTEMELVLEQTQQGTSHEVSVSAKGVEELKRKVKIKGEKKESLLTLRQNRVNTSVVRITKMIADIED